MILRRVSAEGENSLRRIAGSFRFKLAAYFAILALLPLVVAFVGFSTIAERSEVRRADARLEAELGAAVAAYEEALRQAESRAATLAETPAFQRALLERDAVALRRFVRARPHLRVEAPDGFRVGPRAPAAAERRVSVVSLLPPGDEIGDVIATVPFDAELVERLRARSGLHADDGIVLVDGGTIVAAPADAPELRGRLDVRPGETETVELGGGEYRALMARPPQTQSDFGIAVLTPMASIDAANRSLQGKLLLVLLAALALIAAVAYLEGRAIVRTVRRVVTAADAIAAGRLSERVPVRGRDELALLGRSFNDMAAQLEARVADLETERRRLRDASLRFGEALAASHDVDELRRAIVEAAVEATGATRGVLVQSGRELVATGEESPDDERLELPLAAGPETFGMLVLTGSQFTIHDVETASALVSHAAVALDNARLHRIVEEQASFDGLTQLANRRRCEAQLASELARAERFGEPVALVFADLDNFKQVNDRYGHLVGDDVLREFARELRGGIREIDVAGRWGGEEFALILPGTNVDGAVQVAERIRASLARRPIATPDGRSLKLTASFGVAAYPDTGTAEDLLAAADAALYDAKRSGKNRVAARSVPPEPLIPADASDAGARTG